MSKMENINLNEVSLVDHPAHLVEGFAVIKSASPENRALFSALRKETMPEKNLAEVLKDLSAEDIRAALTEEQLAELAPVAKAEEEEPSEDEVLKSLPESVREMFEKQQESIAKAEADAAAAREEAEIAKAERLDTEAITKSKEEYTNLSFAHETVAPALRKFASADPAAAEAIVTMLKAVNAQADGAIFKELGTGHPGSELGETAADRLESIAKARATEENIPFSKAYAAVIADPANKALVSEHFTPKESN